MPELTLLQLKRAGEAAFFEVAVGDDDLVAAGGSAAGGHFGYSNRAVLPPCAPKGQRHKRASFLGNPLQISINRRQIP